MDGIDRASRRRTLDVPVKPETGLAEWTSKIKALQRQVDEDEEAEHRRLEEEITASRLARMRRSTRPGSRGNSLDLSNSEVAIALKEYDASGPLENPRTKQQNQEDTMKKLVGHNTPAQSSNSPLGRNAAPTGISLAAFMGGRAAGPRLTRHAPQQDAHDPTQFDQRTHITTPHPIFGRGGVAMPGMTSNSGRDNAVNTNSKPHAPHSLSPDLAQPAQRDRRTSMPSVVRTFVEKAEEGVTVTPQKPKGSVYDGSYTSRQRTISTPTGSFPPKSPSVPDTRFRRDDIQTGHSFVQSVSRSPAPNMSSKPVRPITPQERHISIDRSRTPQRSDTPSTTPIPRSPTVPHTQRSSPSFTKSPIGAPSLSRPIQPEPRLPLAGPQLPLSSVPSAAFLRAPASKEPTPSISRLQGRGFVQNMVKASSQLAVVPTGSGSPVPRQSAGTPEGGRKTSVLDRWQFENGKNDSPSPPIISPKPIQMRKSRTFDPSHSPSPNVVSPPSPYSPAPQIIRTDHIGKSLKSVASLPSISQPQMPGQSGARISSSRSDVGGVSPSPHQQPPPGSSTTLISYVKPLKTGDNTPINSSPPAPVSRRASPAVDEMGMRIRPRSKSISTGVSEEVERGIHVSPIVNDDGAEGKPLSHPTKHRAKKPRKTRATTKEVVESRQYETTTHTAIQSPSPRAAPSSRSGQESSAASPSFRSTQHDLPPQDTLKSSPSITPIPTLSPHPGFWESKQSHVSSTSQSDGQSVPVARSPLSDSQIQSSAVSSDSNPAQYAERTPPSPRPKKHHRIPSTGNRPTVMDVALALSEHEKHVRELSGDKYASVNIVSSPIGDMNSEETLIDTTEVHVTFGQKLEAADQQGRSRGSPLSVARAEQRKSSYDKYSAFVLPPLAEEATPVASPAGTLVRGALGADVQKLFSGDQPAEQDDVVLQSGFITSCPPEPEAPAIAHKTLVPIEQSDEPLPYVNVDILLAPDERVYQIAPDVQTISIDVMSIVGTSASPVTREQSVFYDSELLVIVHRSKSKSSGLVSTTIWSWCGKRKEMGEREHRKVQELARRYNTSLTPVKQYNEPTDLVVVLGGQLTVRQGTRTHWSKENTAMHAIRSMNGVIFVDEVELSSRNLCSAFSYCLSLLDTFYVWYGRGSTSSEKQAALGYTQSLSTVATSIIELSEGESDDDEMFWMILGEPQYAQADYWKWRPSLAETTPRIWRLGDESKRHSFSVIISFSSETAPHNCIYLIDCKLEYYVVVGKDARSSRRDIRLALSVASELSSRNTESNPFTPPIHVLIFPSQIPGDLRLTFRDFEEFDSRQVPYPDHMNILSVEEAYEHLQQGSWEQTRLKDPTMLPLGIHPADL